MPSPYDYENKRLQGGAAGRVRSMGEREDLLNEAESSFYGGGNAPPTPTPSPTPAPTGMQTSGGAGRQFFQAPQITASQLVNPPKTTTPYSQPSFSNLTFQPKQDQIPVGPFELGWPSPRFDLLRQPTKGGAINPVFQYQTPEATPTPVAPTATPDEQKFYMQNAPIDRREMDDMQKKYGYAAS
jgi:hypothetical protein